MQDTDTQYKAVIEMCSKVFLDKMKDYGTAWRILRTPSLTDQIYIKANRALRQLRNYTELLKNSMDEHLDFY